MLELVKALCFVIVLSSPLIMAVIMNTIDTLRGVDRF
jgi:hypothetical protein